MSDAEYAIVGMGGMMETAEAAVDYMRENMWPQGRRGARHLLRPVPVEPTSSPAALKNVKAVTVVERMDNPLAQSNPLVQGIKASFADALTGLGSGSRRLNSAIRPSRTCRKFLRLLRR